MKKKSSWHGPKQVGLMIYLALLMLIGSCLIGGSTNTVLPVISEQFGWDVGFLRTAAGWGAMAVVVGNFIFGTVSKRKGPRLANTVSLILGALALLLYAWTSSLPVFVAAILLLGTFGGGWYLSSNTAMTANWWPTKKGVVLGITTMGIVLVDLVWIPFIPNAFAAFGVGPTLTAVAIGMVIVAVIGAIFTRDTPEEAGEYPDGDAENAEDIRAVAEAMRTYESPFTIKKVFAIKETWTLGIGMGLMRMVNLAFVASLVPRLLSVGYAYDLTLKVLAVGGVVGLIGSYIVGVLDQKLGTKKATFIYAGIFLGFLILACFHAYHIAIVWVSCVVIQSILGGTANLIPSAIAAKFGRWDYTAGHRVIGSICELGAGLGIMLTGVFHDFQTMYYVCIAFLVVGIILVACSKFDLIGKKG